MAKAVFRPGEVELTNVKVFLEAPFPDIVRKNEVPQMTALEAIPEVFAGPTADELRREAEAFKARWAVEKESMLSGARAEAGVIVTDARKTAEEEAQRISAQALAEVEAAKAKADALNTEAENKAQQAQAQIEALGEEAKQKGLEEGRVAGRQEGYEQGLNEVKRLVERTHAMLEGIQNKRAAILAEAEQQIIDLSLLITRKVIKTISENSKQIVIENIKEALKKVKTKGEINIKVNLSDLEISTAHIEEFIKLVESTSNIKIMEDTTVDSGGCIIETDFGEIDARIASQFAEMESKIIELSPIKENN